MIDLRGWAPHFQMKKSNFKQGKFLKTDFILTFKNI